MPTGRRPSRSHILLRFVKKVMQAAQVMAGQSPVADLISAGLHAVLLAVFSQFVLAHFQHVAHFLERVELPQIRIRDIVYHIYSSCEREIR